MDSQGCWECGKTVDLDSDGYYFFDVTEEVLCVECCANNGVDENGLKIK